MSTVSSILESSFLLSPRVTKSKKKRIARQLRQSQKDALTTKEKKKLQKAVVAVEDAHSRCPIYAYFSELQQMDASSYEWVPRQIWHLHLAINDATGRIIGGWFDLLETLNTYCHIFHQIPTSYGVPYKFLTNCCAVFLYKSKNSPSLDEDTYTLFSYACKQLGAQLESSSVPQKKGWVECLNHTLQSRLPVELRLAGITTIEAANEFLHAYIKEFNEKFSLPLDGIRSVFEKWMNGRQTADTVSSFKSNITACETQEVCRYITGRGRRFW